MDYKKLGERIRQARKAMHYSQEQLAGEIEYSVPHISHVENAKTTLSIDFLVKASNALHVSADNLLCDSLDFASEIYQGEIMESLRDCSTGELKIISRAVMDLKKNLRENMEGPHEDKRGDKRNQKSCGYIVPLLPAMRLEKGFRIYLCCAGWQISLMYH